MAQAGHTTEARLQTAIHSFSRRLGRTSLNWFTRLELAQWTGTAQETICRLLSKYRRQGHLLEKDGILLVRKTTF